VMVVAQYGISNTKDHQGMLSHQGFYGFQWRLGFAGLDILQNHLSDHDLSGHSASYRERHPQNGKCSGILQEKHSAFSTQHSAPDHLCRPQMAMGADATSGLTAEGAEGAEGRKEEKIKSLAQGTFTYLPNYPFTK